MDIDIDAIAKLLKGHTITITIQLDSRSDPDAAGQSTEDCSTSNTEESYRILSAAGVDGPALHDLVREHSTTRIAHVIDRISQTKKSITNPAGYVVRALRCNYFRED